MAFFFIEKEKKKIKRRKKMLKHFHIKCGTIEEVTLRAWEERTPTTEYKHLTDLDKIQLERNDKTHAHHCLSHTDTSISFDKQYERQFACLSQFHVKKKTF